MKEAECNRIYDMPLLKWNGRDSRDGGRKAASL